MMDFINKLQKDVKVFQKNIQKESDELIQKIKTATSRSNLDETRKSVEKLVQQKVRQFEPAIMKFVKDVKENAAKAGIDLGDLEARVQKATQAATSKIMSSRIVRGDGPRKKKTAKKATGASRKPAGKASAAGATRKKKASKRSAD